ncbi:unnamed protein product [Coregonus sp. 'balchen']|nr:unnamed protein product [Coregonus sp. 'balchen']
MLSQICRTHQRPILSAEKSMADTVLKDNHNTRGQCERNESETSPSHHGKVRGNNPVKQGEEDLEQTTSTGADPAMDEEKGGVEEGEGGVEEMEEEGQGVFEESPEEEVQVVEWPAGVPQASAKDLVKLSHVEERRVRWRLERPTLKEYIIALILQMHSTPMSSSTGGLVSILKRRRASLDGLPPEGPDSAKQNSKRKVRFSEPEDGMEPDEVGGDSCLILLLLCLVTMVISLGGTALYCTLVDTYSSICTDFSHNIDFYVVQVRRFLDGLRHWWLERML